jgi:hypothetical protein
MAEDLTAIVVALVGGNALDRCVSAVRAQVADVLVVNRDGTIVERAGKTVGKSERPDIPAKREAAIERARTPLVGLLEDTVNPDIGWADAVREALGADGNVACGGPVKIGAGLPASSRALALSEYGEFNDRRSDSEALSLPGCNFAFRRSAVLDAMQGLDGLLDQVVFRRLREAGGKLAWAPKMGVTFASPNPEGARLGTRFDHGRIYASTEAKGSGSLSRVGKAAKALLLPPVLTLRSLRNANARDLLSLPTIAWLSLQHSAWAAGELTGSLLGPSRKGLGEWR